MIQNSRFFRYPGNLYQNPELYDLVVNNPENELNFYSQQAKNCGTSILELACGTGRIIIELCDTDTNILAHGIDLSKAMLELAQEKARLKNIGVNFQLANIANFSLNSKFDLIFIPLSSLLYLHSLEELSSCFSCVRQHLKSSGLFIFAIFNPCRAILDSPPEKRIEIKRFINPENNREVIVEQSSNYDSRLQINYATHFYSYPDHKDFFYHPVHLRSIFPSETHKLVELFGFKIADYFGDYNCKSFSQDSRFQIVCCKPI